MPTFVSNSMNFIYETDENLFLVLITLSLKLIDTQGFKPPVECIVTL